MQTCRIWANLNVIFSMSGGNEYIWKKRPRSHTLQLYVHHDEQKTNQIKLNRTKTDIQMTLNFRD